MSHSRSLNGPQVELPNKYNLPPPGAKGSMPPPGEVPKRKQESAGIGYTHSHASYEAAFEHYKCYVYADPLTNHVSILAILVHKKLGKKTPTVIGVRSPSCHISPYS